MRVVDLMALAKEHGLQGYSHLRKAELNDFIHASKRQPMQPQMQRSIKPQM